MREAETIQIRVCTRDDERGSESAREGAETAEDAEQRAALRLDAQARHHCCQAGHHRRRCCTRLERMRVSSCSFNPIPELIRKAGILMQNKTRPMYRITELLHIAKIADEGINEAIPFAFE